MGDIDEFVWSDIWLLLSIIYASGSDGEASLEGIIGQGDAINHAIFSLDELNGGLERLISAGYIFEKNDGYAPTEKALSIYHEVSNSKRYVRDVLEGIRERLQVKPWDPTYKPKYSASGKYVSSKEFERAYMNYKSEFNKQLKEIERKEKMYMQGMIEDEDMYEYDEVIEGAEAERYRNEHLERVRVDHEKWEVEYIDEKTGEKWIMDYPHSEYHGGGPPRLRRIRMK